MSINLGSNGRRDGDRTGGALWQLPPSPWSATRDHPRMRGLGEVSGAISSVCPRVATCVAKCVAKYSVYRGVWHRFLTQVVVERNKVQNVS